MPTLSYVDKFSSYVSHGLRPHYVGKRKFGSVGPASIGVKVSVNVSYMYYTCTEVSGVENIGQCGRLSQLSWLLGAL